MRSLNLVHIISGLNNGGAEAVLFRLTTGDERHTHHVISLMDEGLYGKRLTSAGIRVYTLQMPRGAMTFKGLLNLYRLIQTINPDIVQTWMYHADLIGGVVARLAGKRAVVWGVRSSDAHVQSKKITFKLLVRLCAWLSKNIPAKIIFASQAGAKVHNDLGYPREKSKVISNGYATAELMLNSTMRDRLRAEWGYRPDALLIGMVGRWDPLKDHDTLIAALSRLTGLIHQSCSLVLIGSGMNDTNVELVHLLERYGMVGRTKLCGPRSDIPAVMNAIDIHVLSSISEGFPNVVAEAMACGTPCVVTDVGDGKLIVGDTGWVVSPSDPPALANALQEAIVEMQDDIKWDARRGACRSRILTKFSLEHMVEEYNKVWQEVSHA